MATATKAPPKSNGTTAPPAQSQEMTAPQPQEQRQLKPHEAAMVLRPPRLPYHPAIEERFGIDKASWKALVEAIFPNATSVESVILALSYCRARKLDPFKRNVHIVPIWDKQTRSMVDTIWPGIGELRTTAFRTGEYAGRGETVCGPDVSQKIGTEDMTFPEWARVAVYRMVKGQKVEFVGPKVYWLETYAQQKRDDLTPNEMWRNRPRGQLEKCAEAAALRAAFPEEIGSDFIDDEVQHMDRKPAIEGKAVQTLDDLTERLTGPVADADEATQEEPTGSPSITADPETDPLAFCNQMEAAMSACQTAEEIDAIEAELLGRGLTQDVAAEVGMTAARIKERLGKQ